MDYDNKYQRAIKEIKGDSLVCTIRPGILEVCTISSSGSSFGSLEETEYRDISPAIG